MNATDELIAIADAAAEALSHIREPRMQEDLAAIAKASNEVGRAWSGSNIGYHSTVYCQGLEPRPPNVQFSSEWGLEEVWPTHVPNRIWTTYDNQAVVDEILRRAGGRSTDAINTKLAPLRDTFLRLKEASISILTVTLSNNGDAFVDRKLQQVQDAAADDVSTLVSGILPRKFWSRDSLAASQGIKPAPHQCVAAVPAAATSLENAFDRLEKSVREAASHLRRIESRSKKASLVGTNVFIGHGRSPIWRELKDFVEDRLDLPVDEFNSVPVAGISTTARLSELLDSAAFAFLIMTAEDELADGRLNARLNVVHEIGLFQGRLGFTRAIVLLEESCDEFSNIHGLNQIRFPKGNIGAKFEEIRAVLERERLIEA